MLQKVKYLIFILSFVLYLKNESLLAGDLSTTNVEPQSLEAGASSIVGVVFQTAEALPNNGRIIVRFPFGFDLSGATFLFSLQLDGTFNLTVDEIAREVILSRNGDGTEIPSQTVVTLAIDNIKNPEPIGKTGTYAIETRTSFNTTIDKDQKIPGDTIISTGSFDFLESLSRKGGLVARNSIFEIRVGITDQFGNLNINDNSTSVSLNPVGGTGTLSGGNATATNGVASFQVFYNKVEKISLEAQMMTSSGPVTLNLGNYYVVDSVEGPTAPDPLRVVETGNRPLDFRLEWKSSLTPNATYEVWQQHSELLTPPQLFPGVGDPNQTMDFGYPQYAEFFNGSAYHCYFSAFSRAYNDVYSAYSQWRLVASTPLTQLTPGYSQYSSYGDFLIDNRNYSEFASYQVFTGYGDFYTNNFFMRPYGAFRIFAVDPQGRRSLASAEILRGPIPQMGKPQNPGFVVKQDDLLPPPENVVVFNDQGQIRLEWRDVDPLSTNKFHIYRKVKNIRPGIYNEYAQYSKFSFFAETTLPLLRLESDTSYASYHEYSAFKQKDPFGIYKVIAVKNNGERSATSQESRTVRRKRPLPKKDTLNNFIKKP